MHLNRAEVFLLAIALFGSFGLALWLTAPSRPLISNRDLIPADKWAAHTIATDYALNREAQALGFHTSSALTGYVDSMDRLDKDTVTAKGWLADSTSDGSPSYVLAYVGGKLVASVRTHGQRPDVTGALHLTNRAGQSVAYTMTFACHLGDMPLLVGLNANRYAHLSTKPCP